MDMTSSIAAFAGISSEDVEKLQDTGFRFHRGKVCDIVSNGYEMLLIYTDRISAFDRHIGLVPGKGEISATMSEFWFTRLPDIAHHFLARPHPRIIKAKQTTPLKIEVIVRGYLAGSLERAYRQGTRSFCGVKLEDGIKPYARLATPIITPTTKEKEHDQNITPAQIIATELCTNVEWEKITSTALTLFRLGNEIYRSHGYVLADTKYEFGRDSTDNLTVIDEIHSQDSSRLWLHVKEPIADQPPPAVDKDIARRYLLEHNTSSTVPATVLDQLSRTYRRVTAKLTGMPASVSSSPVNYHTIHQFLTSLA